MAKQKPWLAALLSVIETSLGLFYGGQPRTAVKYWVSVHVAYVLASVAVATGRLNAPMLLIAFFVLLMVRLAAPVAAWRLASRATEGRRWFQRWPGLLLIFAVVACVSTGVQLLNKAYVLETFSVPGRAMASTINHQDRIFVDKLFSRAKNVRRGDLVVYKVESEGPIFVGRILALEGDTISLLNQNLHVNDEIVEEPYASYRDAPLAMADLHETTVPFDHIFVLGDNRNFSSDSRAFGPIPIENYYGRPTNIYFSRQYNSIDAAAGPVHTPGPVAWERIGRNIVR